MRAAPPPPSVRSQPFDRSRKVLLAVAAGIAALALLPALSEQSLLAPQTKALWIASASVAVMAMLIGRDTER